MIALCLMSSRHLFPPGADSLVTIPNRAAGSIPPDSQSCGYPGARYTTGSTGSVYQQPFTARYYLNLCSPGMYDIRMYYRSNLTDRVGAAAACRCWYAEGAWLPGLWLRAATWLPKPQDLNRFLNA
jgi:hypothetical protein